MLLEVPLLKEKEVPFRARAAAEDVLPAAGILAAAAAAAVAVAATDPTIEMMGLEYV